MEVGSLGHNYTANYFQVCLLSQLGQISRTSRKPVSSSLILLFSSLNDSISRNYWDLLTISHNYGGTFATENLLIRRQILSESFHFHFHFNYIFFAIFFSVEALPYHLPSLSSPVHSLFPVVNFNYPCLGRRRGPGHLLLAFSFSFSFSVGQPAPCISFSVLCTRRPPPTFSFRTKNSLFFSFHFFPFASFQPVHLLAGHLRCKLFA